MKYLLLLVVVAIGVWMLTAKSRVNRRRDVPGAPGAGAAPNPRNKPTAPQVMLSCAHCGVHLPQADALGSGERVYCSEPHRRLGPGPSNT